MMRTLLTILIASFLVLPASAKSKRDVYPMACDVLWTAVKNALDSPRDYGVLSENDLSLQASFVVVGNLVKYTDRITLEEEDGGCRMNLRILQVGADNTDERAFRKRLKKSLAKLEAAKPAPAGQPKAAAVMGQQ